MNRDSAIVAAVLVAIAVPAVVCPADQFTYQAKVNDGGSPAEGVYDLKFRLYNAAVGGAPLGVGELIIDDVDIAAGLVTVDLDFGAGVFDGGDRWLEIDVKADADGAYTTLSPRQPIQPTPYAHFAAAAAGVADGGLGAVYNSPISFTDPSNQFAGNGSGLTKLNASAVLTGNLSAARMPTGGAWNLNSDLDLNGGALFVNQSSNEVGIGTTTTQPGFDLSVAQTGVFGAGASRVEIDGSSGDMRGYGPDGLQDWDIAATSDGHGQILLWDATNGNLTAALTARDDAFFAGGELFLGDRDGQTSVTIDGDAGPEQAARITMRNAPGLPTIQFDAHGAGDPTGGARLSMMDGAGTDRVVLDAEGPGSRILANSESTTDFDAAIEGNMLSSSGGHFSAAIRGTNNATSGQTFGLHGLNASPSGAGVFGNSSNAAGVLGNSVFGVGVHGTSASGLAGQFDGTTFINGSMGIGTSAPEAALDIEGTAGVDGIRFPDETTQTTAYTGSGTIVNAGFVGGSISAIPGSSADYVFAGSTTSITVDGSQRIVTSGSAPLGHSGAGPVVFDVGMGYQLGAGTVTNFAGFNYMICRAPAGSRHTYAVNCSHVLPAGTYTIGVVVRNGNVQGLDSNDYVNFSYMVIQE